MTIAAVPHDRETEGLAHSPPVPFKKAINIGMLSTGVPYRQRFQQAADFGFMAVEWASVAEKSEADLVLEAAQAIGTTIHSVFTPVHWSHPLTSQRAEDVRTLLAAIEKAFANAKLWGAKTLQLNPGIVNSETPHATAFRQSQKIIREEVIPMAREFGVVVGVENMTFTGMLSTPLEYARYISEFESPWLQAYLDLGNVLPTYPEHWIRELGDKIVALHLKDFRVEQMRGTFAHCELGTGDIDWGSVRSALLETGYSGYVTSTSMPKGRLSSWGNLGVHVGNKYNPGFVPGWSLAVRALAAFNHRANASFVKRHSERHDQFDAGTVR